MGSSVSKIKHLSKPPAQASAPALATQGGQAPVPAAPPKPGTRVESHSAYGEGTEYKGAPIPENDGQRLNYLCSLGVLDTPPEPRFDEITKLACMIFKVPIALVSLVDKDRQWFKSVQGLQTDNTDRQSSFCAWTLLPEHPEILVVEDATQDARFSQNKLVLGPPDIRFYAGCPLIASNAFRLGSLCVIDRKPRTFDAEQCMMLANLAEMVVRELEKERKLELEMQKSRNLAQENEQLLRAIDAFNEGIVLVDVSKPEWPVEFINEAWEQLTGFRKDDLGQGFWGKFTLPPGEKERVVQLYTEAIQESNAFEILVSFEYPGEGKRWMTLQMRSANTENFDSYMPLVGIPAELTGGDLAAGMGGAIYYFATLLPHQVTDSPHMIPLNHMTPRSMSTLSNTGQLSSISSPANAISSTPNSTARNAFVLHTKTDPFSDVKLGQLLGRGSFGRVYRGQWNGAQVAVKVLEYTAGDSAKQGMEALLSAQLSHPNIVQTFKHCSREMAPAEQGEDSVIETWMVMEFCNKGSLSDGVDKGWFRQKNSLFDADYRTLLTSAKEVASALCYLHELNILHGDLNGNNVLLTASEKDHRHWTAKVADFGLSRVLEGVDQIQTHTFGTVTHMPPEMLVEGHMTKASDVYAFGVIMWELFMGQRPWAGLSHGQIIHAITSGKTLSLSSSCPADLKKFILKCMAPSPEARPTFSQILKDLETLEEDLVGL